MEPIMCIAPDVSVLREPSSSLQTAVFATNTTQREQQDENESEYTRHNDDAIQRIKMPNAAPNSTHPPLLGFALS